MSETSIMMSLRPRWAAQILIGEKPFEFRSVLPKRLLAGDTIYLYETGYQGGRKAVVGECLVKSIIKLTNDKGEFPCFGSYHFIDWYAEHIAKDPDAALMFAEAKKYNLENYKWGSHITFALCPEAMAYIKAGKYPDPYDKHISHYSSDKRSRGLIDSCDLWLRSMGFYDWDDKSYWKYAIEIDSPQEYSQPNSLSAFFKADSDETIKTPPQSWMYCRRRDSI